MEKRRYIPFVTTSITEDICLAILLIPLWWVLGIKFLVFHLIALLTFIKLLAQRQKTPEKFIFPAEVFFLLGYIALYSLSLLINFKNISTWRFFASLNNLSFWVMGLLIVFVITNSIKREDILSFLRSFRNFGIITSVFSLSTLLLSIILHKFIQLQTPLCWLLPDGLREKIIEKAPLLWLSIRPNIITATHIFKKRKIPRPEGFNNWATGLAMTMLFAIVLTIAYYKIKKKKKGFTIILTLEFLTLFASMTRNPIMGLLFAWITVYIIKNIKKSLSLKILTPALILLVIAILLIPHNIIKDTIVDVRLKPTIWRYELYKMTLTQAIEKPILGYGFKPRKEQYPDPIGSHSTYIGVIYKTGFLGFLVFMLFWIILLKRWLAQMNPLSEDETLKHAWFYSGIALFGGFIYMITQDLDAPPVVAFLFFVIIGVIISLGKLKKQAVEK
ncbi:MAG: O-antigen ligase family protein [Candidatus Aminicenantes bacterium]|nr:MAG: O-antigen ligase family protein [Candidatus Aminicenantes bacterium]